MGSTVEAPKPTAEEKQLQAEQAALLRQQRDILQEQNRVQQALLPIFASQSGLELKFDKQGNIIGASQTADFAKQQKLQQESATQSLAMQGQFLKALQDQLTRQAASEAELAPLREMQLQVETQLAERSLKALRGELDVDPALERELKTQEETLRDRLRQQLGSGFETSTPGIEALQRFTEGAAALRSGAQTGQLTLAEQLGIARTGLRTGEQGATLQQLLGGSGALGQLGATMGAGGAAMVPGQQQAIFGLPMQLAGGLGQVAGGFGVAQVPFQQQRGMEFQANMFNAQNSGIGALGGIFGSILGAMPFSDIRLKKWAIPIGETDGGVPVYLFAYDGDEGRTHIGVIAQEVPWAAVEQRGYLAVDYERIN